MACFKEKLPKFCVIFNKKIKKAPKLIGAK